MAFVLIFDGNETHAMRASDALSTVGHACGWVTDMQQATRVLRRRVPDLILLDQAVPGADGGTIPAWLRRISGVEDLPIILLTSRACAASIGPGSDVGVDDSRKPFDPRCLAWRVDHALESRRRSDLPFAVAGGARREAHLRSIA